jgi:hypothetical protein
LAEKWVKTTEHESLYFEYWITFILYVLPIHFSFRIRHYLWDTFSSWRWVVTFTPLYAPVPPEQKAG